LGTHELNSTTPDLEAVLAKCPKIVRDFILSFEMRLAEQTDHLEAERNQLREAILGFLAQSHTSEGTDESHYGALEDAVSEQEQTT